MDVTPTSSLSSELQAGLDRMSRQLLIVLVTSLGGDVTIPVSEIDGTGDRVMFMEVLEDEKFRFIVKKKQ